jgi:type IV secretory pathway VirB4 component
MLISGKIGSGKSYFAKLETWRRLMIDPEVEVLIIDPVGGETGFTDMVNALDGQRITVDGTNIINPMEIRRDSSGEQRGDAYEQKIQSVLGMCKSSFRGDLSKQEEGILLRAIRFAYLKKGITPSPETHDNESPVMQDVLDILKEMSQGRSPRDFMEVPPELESYISAIEMETGGADEDQASQNEFVQRNREKEATYAQNVWLGLEDFQDGGQNGYLNGQTNVDINARVVQFDISAAVDKGSAPLLMHVVLDWLFQRTKGTDARNQVVIDEAHYMLGQDNALDMLELFARHSRHYNSGLTLISQTVAEFLHNDQTRAIYGQCDIRALMRHEDLGQEECEALGMTEQERQFVLQAKAGNTSDHSESLMHIGEIGKVRIKVLSNSYEHNVIDDGADPWAYLYESGMISWWDIPEDKQREAWPYLDDESQREIEQEYQELTGEA